MRLQCDKSEKSSFITRKILAAVILALPLGIAACGDQQVAPEQIRPVKAMIVPPAVTERSLVYSGVLAPRIESTLGFRVSGKIIERFVNAGDQIKAGQPIARLDEKDLKLAENSARAAVAAAKTRLDVATDALNRANYLLPNGFIAKSAVDQRQLEADSARSALDAAQDQLNQAINATSYALLVADKDGIVTSIRAEPGQVVSAGQAVITLAHAEDMEVFVAVPEHEITKLKAGDRASVALWANPSIGSEGKIREIAGAADAASRTYGVRVSIVKPSPEMRLGMTTAIVFTVRQDAPAIVLPLTALTEYEGEKVAFVVDRERETVAKRPVAVADVTDGGVKIKSGLKPGEIVVTAGVQFLQDGMRVRLPKELLTAVADATRSSR